MTGVQTCALPILPEAGYKIVDLANDQAEVLDLLGITEPIDVFGISMGGMVAQELALHHPEKVRTLALGCTSAGGDAMTPPLGEDLMGLYEAQMSGDEARLQRYGFEFYMGPSHCEEPGNLEKFVALGQIYPTPFEVLVTQLQAVDGYSTADRLPSLTIPTVVIHGTLDRVMPYPNAEPLTAAIPGATHEIFDGAGHLLHLEDGPSIAAILEEVSARQTAPASA